MLCVDVQNVCEVEKKKVIGKKVGVHHTGL